MGGAGFEASNQFTWSSETEESEDPRRARAMPRGPEGDVKRASLAGLNLRDALAATLCMWRALHSIAVDCGDPAETRQPDDERSAPRLTESVHGRDRGGLRELGPLPLVPGAVRHGRAKARDNAEGLALQRHPPDPGLRPKSRLRQQPQAVPGQPCNDSTEPQHNQPTWWSNNMSSTGSTAS
jgi:hypothetical protein